MKNPCVTQIIINYGKEIFMNEFMVLSMFPRDQHESNQNIYFI